MEKLIVSFATVALISVLTAVLGCSPAKWKEMNADASGNSPFGGGSPVNAPQSQATTENFVQDAAANKVDILIVNDNSASMDPEQRKMAERFASFVSALNGIDYRIAMTTTDVESANWNQDGKIMTWNGTSTRVLTPSTSHADVAFRETIARSETIGCQKRNDCPSGNEQPLRAIERAIDQRSSANKSLFRDGVDFVTVILSDEDEMSNGTSAKATAAADVVAHFSAAFGATKRMAVHSLIVMPGDAKCLSDQAAQISTPDAAFYGTHAAALSSLTGGTVHSICDTDYTRDLQAISTEVRKLISSFDLQQTPKDGTVSVILDPAFKTSWSVEGTRLIFNPAPPAGTKIEVQYRY